jgi:hypothetical protein
MKIRIVAIANIGTFMAGDADGNYSVITLDDTKDVDLGDVLNGTFDGRGSLFYSVDNLTKKEKVRICLEHWDCTLAGAIQALLEFNGVRTVDAGAKRFVIKSMDAARQIHAEIART